jgi:hypothetical protein
MNLPSPLYLTEWRWEFGKTQFHRLSHSRLLSVYTKTDGSLIELLQNLRFRRQFHTEHNFQYTAPSVQPLTMSTYSDFRRRLEWEERHRTTELEGAAVSAMSLFKNKPPSKRVSNKITVKEIAEKLKYATKPEMVQLLDNILQSEAVAVAVLANYTPDFPVATDPILYKCFHCKSDRCKLYDFHEVKVCHICYDLVAYRRLTREKVIDVFLFTKAEAMKIPGHSGPHSTYSGYEFNLEKVIKAVTKRDGSFFHFVERKHGRSRTPTALQLLLAAPTKSERKPVLKHVLKASKESTLKRLIKEAVKFHPMLKEKGGVLDAVLQDLTSY